MPRSERFSGVAAMPFDCSSFEALLSVTTRLVARWTTMSQTLNAGSDVYGPPEIVLPVVRPTCSYWGPSGILESVTPSRCRSRSASLRPVIRKKAKQEIRGSPLGTVVISQRGSSPRDLMARADRVHVR